MTGSINTNLAAISARSNIDRANTNTSASIARLSSGNRITRAADDVAALSVGTALRTQVTSLRQALLNASQGSSLLQVADGALGQVTDILQRQKALAVQAGSGTLSDTDRSFLNQEFTSLTAEIDRIADGTRFSSVNLLNGELSGSRAITTNTNNNTAAVAGATAGAVITVGGALANNDQIIVNGVTVTFSTSAPGTVAAAGRVSIGASATDTASNLVAFLNSSTDPRLSNLTFTNAAGAVSANYSGGLLNGAYVVNASVVTGANLTAGTAANRTIAVTNPVDGLTIDRTKAVGTVSGSLLANGGTVATAAGPAIVTRTIQNNADFVGQLGTGRIGRITSQFTGVNDTAVFSLTVGNITYSTAATLISGGAAPIALSFTGRSNITNAAAGGTFTLNIRGGSYAAGALTSQALFDQVSSQLNSSLAGVSFVQNRDVTSFQEGQVVRVAGVEVGQLDGLSANIQTDNFNNVNIESVRITAPAVGSSDATFEVSINGEIYRSQAGIGNQIATNTSITLQNLTNPNRVFTIQTGTTALTNAAGVSLDLSNQANADAVARALQDGFGISATSGRVTFQVGANASDSLSVRVDSARTSSLYQGRTLSVGTLADANLASSAIDTALNTVTAIRANVGALQSRFDFASANVESSLQNQDAARGALLDTDVTAESTAYSTAQVQLQAGIAVLAQANQLPQNLLKLIQ